jgi:hypothetical protein
MTFLDQTVPLPAKKARRAPKSYTYVLRRG